MKKAFFIGIGGIGMSALAQYLKGQGVEVSGSDRSESPVTELLEKKGISVIIGQKAENVPADADVVIYSDAVPEDNPEREAARAQNIPEYSYFKMLGKISEGKTLVAVAGTHGKTTTTGMLARILHEANASPTAIVGSIVKDFGSNYLPGTSGLFVVEACEYKDHILELSPTYLVITNLEWDHTDYFPSLAALQETFKKAIAKVPAGGAVITNPADPNVIPILATATCRVIDYTKEPAFDLKLPGEFNQMNARAAGAAARAASPLATDAIISSALSQFEGTWRRFEFKGTTKTGAVVYDDYAHHPTAVAKTLEALREKSHGKVWVAFQPHLFSRTRDLLNEFASAFKDANEVIIAPIYAAREKDDGTVSSQMLAELISAHGTPAIALDTFATIQAELEKAGPLDAVITMGAGDIYKVAEALTGRS